jgi:hypothetical protein
LDTFFGEYSHVIEKLGRFVNSKLPQEYAEEIYGCADYLFNETQQEKWGWLTILNIGYEISDACTSIVAKLPNGTVIHGRNMDFSIGGPLTNTLKDVVLVAKVYDGDELKYITTTFAGFIGVITGQKPGGYSVTVDTRFYPQGLWELFFEAIVAITERNYTLVSFLARDTLTNVNRYENAVEKLSYGNLIADVYYIVAGLNDGAIITRNRTGPVDIWRLTSGVASDKASYSKSGVASDKASYSKSGVASDKASYSKSGVASGAWYILETNYDHWKNAPWFDNRRGAAINALNMIGQSGMSVESMLSILSTKPVLNIQTEYSFLSVPETSYYHSVTRYCQYPCTE